jgi:hypothetical protein
MARWFVAGALFGAVVVAVGGAALGIHAADEAGSGASDELYPEKAEQPEVREVAAVPTPEPAYGIWDDLAHCESSGRWHLNSGNSYFGGLQEDLVFWRRHGGLAYASRPDLATRGAQIAVAQRGLAVQGWQAWPACSRRLGLR